MWDSAVRRKERPPNRGQGCYVQEDMVSEKLDVPCQNYIPGREAGS